MDTNPSKVNKYELAARSRGFSVKDPDGKYVVILQQVQEILGTRDRSETIKKVIEQFPVLLDELKRLRTLEIARVAKWRRTKIVLGLLTVVQVIIAVAMYFQEILR